MKSGLVYSLNSVLVNPCIFHKYKIVYDAQHTTTVREERDVSWVRRLFGASKTEFVETTEPDPTVVIYDDYMIAHPSYRKQLEQSIKEYQAGRL